MKVILTWRPACPLFILQRANAVCQALSRLQDPRPGKGQVSPKPSPGNHLSGALNHEETQHKTNRNIADVFVEHVVHKGKVRTRKDPAPISYMVLYFLKTVKSQGFM